MKMKFILSVFLFSAGVLATEVNGAERGSTGSTEIQQTIQNEAGMDKLSFNIQKLYSSGRVRYVKNPCAGQRGYRLNQYRGFSFENGEVAKFQLNGWFRAEPGKYDSLGQFFSKRGLCRPLHKKLPVLQNIGLESLEIW